MIKTMKKTSIIFSLLLITSWTNAQILTATDDEDFLTWTTADLDGDGEFWELGSFDTYFGLSGFETNDYMASYSYDNDALTPDNIFISPALDFSNLTLIDLTWKMGARGDFFFNQPYAVYVVTHDFPFTEEDFADPIIEGVIQNSNEWNNFGRYLDDWAGEPEVHLVFRHHMITGVNSNNPFFCLDDIEVVNASCPSLVSEINSTNESIAGANDGTASVTTTGGTFPYTYSWSPFGGVNATATGLGAGIYTCTVTDSQGCSNVIETPVNQYLSCDLTATTATGNNGTATISPTGGTEPYSYFWLQTGSTLAFGTGLSPGTYNIEVTDDAGCSADVIVIINDSECSITATATSTDETAFGANDGTAAVSADGGIEPYSYFWTPSGGFDATASGLTPGTYTAVVADSAGCSAAASVFVSIASVTGSIENIELEEIKVYPNPANDVLNFSMNQNISAIRIMGLDGKVVYNESVNTPSLSVDLSSFSSGTYFYQIRTEKGSFIRNSFMNIRKYDSNYEYS